MDHHTRNHCNALVVAGTIISTTVLISFQKVRAEEKQATSTWDASTFITYQIIAIGAEGFKSI
jgi:hypothetical protein